MADFYVTNKRLRELVSDARTTGRASDELGSVLLQMAEGIRARYQRELDTDEFKAGAVLHVLSRLEKIDISKNVFSWITTVIVNFGRQCRRKQQSEERTLARLLDSKRPDRRRGRPADAITD